MNPNRDKYPDPTAKKVERELTAEELEVSYLVKMIRQIAAWAGYDVVNRKFYEAARSQMPCFREDPQVNLFEEVLT